MNTASIIVKLGGSVITDKKVSFSYRAAAVRELGRAVRRSGLPVVIVHGGGSFGHPLAAKYGLSSRKPSPSPRGVTETREAMLRLDERVCASLSSAGLLPYPFSPFSLLDTESGSGALFLKRLLSAGATPVTFGDVVHDGRGFRIISGDTICVELSRVLRARTCVMAMDVPGILDGRGATIRVLAEEGQVPRRKGTDATGGVRFKAAESLRMAASGTEVRLVSGLEPAEFSKALNGVSFNGTTVRVPHDVSIG